MSFASNAEFYAFIESLIDGLQAAGLPEPSRQLDDALHAGCTSGEVLADLGRMLTSIQQTYDARLPRELLVDLTTAQRAVDRALGR